MEVVYKDCPDCKNESPVLFSDDYVSCPTCEDSGEVEISVKGWIRNILESNIN